MNDAITPFTLAVPQADLEDLNRRIDQTRWPDAETVDDWTQGAPLAKVKALVDHWRHRGGHFAAWEQPALHAKEIRDCVAKVR
jgi:Epoxide hydrolase N terminus